MKKQKSAASSRPGKLTRKNESDIRAYRKSPQFEKDLARARAFPRDPTPAQLRDIPVLANEELATARPFQELERNALKQSITVRLDAPIVAWLKAKGGRYQTHMNEILRDAMLADRSQ